MKHKISLLLLLSLAIFSLSCKKDAENKPTVELEYRIAPSADMVFRIVYTDASGAEVVSTNLDGFPGASKRLNVTTPFTGKLTVDVDNYSPYLKTFTLTILVNGEVKATKEFPVGPNLEGAGTVQYKIE